MLAAIDEWELSGLTAEELGAVLARATRPRWMLVGRENIKTRLDTYEARFTLRSKPATAKLLAAELG